MSIPVNQAILSRTLRVRSAAGVGSGFYCEIDGFAVVVTAAHLMKGAVRGERFAVKHGGDWVFVDIREIGFCAMGSDVCVILPKTRWGEGLPEKWLAAGAFVGQETRYSGYPLDIETKGLPDDPYPMPLVKGGVFSGAEQRDGWMMYLIDTLNNRGFSGGPVLVIDKDTEVLSVAAVVSGYRYDAPVPLMSKLIDGTIEESADKFVRPNSGFMRAVPIALAVALAHDVVGNRAT